ncbi:hypothetical protein D3C76_1700750 [compost metagenome]
MLFAEPGRGNNGQPFIRDIPAADSTAPVTAFFHCAQGIINFLQLMLIPLYKRDIH